MEFLWEIIALAPFIIICLASIAAAVLFIRKAVRDDAHRIGNIVPAIIFILIPIVIYVFLYILGRIITG